MTGINVENTAIIFQHFQINVVLPWLISCAYKKKILILCKSLLIFGAMMKACFLLLFGTILQNYHSDWWRSPISTNEFGEWQYAYVWDVPLFMLSHTWVWYPGLSGLSVQYWPRWFQDFPAIWLAVSLAANGVHLGIYTLPEKCLFYVWNNLFRGEIKFSQRRTSPMKSLWWQIVPMQESTNEWKNLTISNIMGLAETQW